MRPSFIHTVSVKFPELYILGAHLGNPWYTEAAEVARLRPRVYWDVTGSTLIKTEKNLKAAQQYVEAFAGLAKTSNTLIVPASASDVAGFVATAMTVLDKTRQAQAAAKA